MLNKNKQEIFDVKNQNENVNSAQLTNNHQNKILYIFLTLFLIGSSLIIGIYIGKGQVVNKVNVEPVAQTTTASPAIDNTTPDSKETIYVNEKLGFQLEHPNEIEFMPESTINDKNINGRMKDEFYKSPGDYFEFNIEVSDQTNKSVLEKNGYASDDGFEKETIMVAGQSVTSYSGSGGEGGAYPFKMFAIEHGKQTYYFYISTFNKWGIVDKILNSFKFIN